MSIGLGGMGTVFEADDQVGGRPVAVKVLHPHLARERTYIDRFRLEAESAGRLRHPHIVEVLDAGEDEGLFYLVMEFLDGPSLRAIVGQRGGLGGPQVVRLARQALSGIGAAHETGVIHRDLKPANLLVVAGPDGERAKVVDFGIATLWSTSGYVRLTATGEIIGTPEYMAPEQLRDGPIGPPLDLYGIGLIMYYALAGRTPFRNDDGGLPSIQRILLNRYMPLDEVRPDLPRALCEIVHRAIAVRPDERYESAAAMARALGEIGPGVLEAEETLPVRPGSPPPSGPEAATAAARPVSRQGPVGRGSKRAAPAGDPAPAPSPEPGSPEPGSPEEAESDDTLLQQVWPSGVPPRTTLDLVSEPASDPPPSEPLDDDEPTLPHGSLPPLTPDALEAWGRGVRSGPPDPVAETDPADEEEEGS